MWVNRREVSTWAANSTGKKIKEKKNNLLII